MLLPRYASRGEVLRLPYRTSIHPYDFCMSRCVHYIMNSERKLVLKGGIFVDLSAIGSRIKVARERKHFTQEDLAAMGYLPAS